MRSPPSRRSRPRGRRCSTPAERRRPAWVAAIFVAVGWAALEFALEGVVSAIIDRDPLPTGLSPFLGFGLVVLRLAVVWFGVARASASSGPWLLAVATGAIVWLVTVLAGLALGGLRLALAEGTGPFLLVAAVSAVLVTAVAGLVLRRTGTEHREVRDEDDPRDSGRANPRTGV